MSISPFSAHPMSPEGESRRARLALLAAVVGIAATLLAYAVSPGVRHAVSHAEHSVKHAVSRVFHPGASSHPKHAPQLVKPLRRAHQSPARGAVSSTHPG
jgi:hypothetical protein